jgi:hypothetical protein
VDFTREPIIETVITPKEGYKLVVRNSKGVGQEEYFVDAVEVVTFGNAIFLRSLERPKAFMVPASDYEILEAREARIVLKNVGLDRSIKIGGGREAALRAPKEAPEEKAEVALKPEEARSETRGDRKKDRRRLSRRRRGREEGLAPQESVREPLKVEAEEPIRIPAPEQGLVSAGVSEAVSSTGSLMSHLLSPPPLISETIGDYKKRFKDAFYTKEEQEASLTLDAEQPAGPGVPIEQPEFGTFELSEEEEEEIFRQRRRRYLEQEENQRGEDIFEGVKNEVSSSEPHENTPQEKT